MHLHTPECNHHNNFLLWSRQRSRIPFYTHYTLHLLLCVRIFLTTTRLITPQNLKDFSASKRAACGLPVLL